MGRPTTVSILLILAAWAVGCVGTDGSADDDRVPYEADLDTEPYKATCDDERECWGRCFSCAVEDACATPQTACDEDPSCAALMACVRACPGGGWGTCHDLCVDYHGQPNQTFLDLWNCTYCNECVDSCDHFKLSCDSYGQSPIVPGPGLSDDGLVWKQANLTWYTSYPEPGSDECLYYSGCDYMGYFAFFNGIQKPESWVQANNIAAVHSDHFGQYAGKTLRVRQGGNQIDVRVYDMCSDDDCSNCCSNNMSETGFLIDMEYYTMQRFGGQHGVVEWTCLNC